MSGAVKAGVAGYHAWQKAILRDDRLRKIASGDRWDIRVIAFAIASFGPPSRGGNSGRGRRSRGRAGRGEEQAARAER